MATWSRSFTGAAATCCVVAAREGTVGRRRGAHRGGEVGGAHLDPASLAQRDAVDLGGEAPGAFVEDEAARAAGLGGREPSVADLLEAERAARGGVVGLDREDRRVGVGRDVGEALRLERPRRGDTAPSTSAVGRASSARRASVARALSPATTDATDDAGSRTSPALGPDDHLGGRALDGALDDDPVLRGDDVGGADGQPGDPEDREAQRDRDAGASGPRRRCGGGTTTMGGSSDDPTLPSKRCRCVDAPSMSAPRCTLVPGRGVWFDPAMRRPLSPCSDVPRCSPGRPFGRRRRRRWGPGAGPGARRRGVHRPAGRRGRRRGDGHRDRLPRRGRRVGASIRCASTTASRSAGAARARSRRPGRSSTPRPSPGRSTGVRPHPRRGRHRRGGLRRRRGREVGHAHRDRHRRGEPRSWTTISTACPMRATRARRRSRTTRWVPDPRASRRGTRSPRC